MSNNKIITEKELKYIEPNPEKRFDKIMSGNIKRKNMNKNKVNLLRSDISSLPRGQKYFLYSVVEPFDTTYDLFYSWAFAKFVDYARNPIIKFITDNGDNYDKDDATYIHDEYEKFFNTNFKELCNKQNVLEKRFIDEDDELNNEKFKNEKENINKLKTRIENELDTDKIKLVNIEIEKLKTHYKKRKLDDEIRNKERRDERYKQNMLEQLRSKKMKMSKIIISLNERKKIIYRKSADYINKYFKKFIELNRRVLDNEFEEIYNTRASSLIKFWGAFKSDSAAARQYNNIRGKVSGKLFKKESGVFQLYNESYDDVKYVNEEANKIMIGMAEKIKQAKDEIFYRKEVLKEKEMRNSGIIYETYNKESMSEKTLGTKVNKKELQKRPLEHMSNDEINQEFEYYNPLDEQNLKMESKEDFEERNKNYDALRNIIDLEMKSGNSHIINPEMMELLNMDEKKISEVRKSKLKAHEEEHEKLKKGKIEKVRFKHGKKPAKSAYKEVKKIKPTRFIRKDPRIKNYTK